MQTKALITADFGTILPWAVALLPGFQLERWQKTPDALPTSWIGHNATDGIELIATARPIKITG